MTVPPEGDTESEDQRDRMVELWSMATLHDPPLSVREIAARTGMARSTVDRWIRACREADGFVDLLNRSEARVAQAGRLDDYLGALRRRLAEGADPERIIPILLAVEDRITAVVGTKAPVHVQHEDVTGRVAPDAELAAKVRDARALAQRERAQIVDGEVLNDDRTDDDPER